MAADGQVTWRRRDQTQRAQRSAGFTVTRFWPALPASTADAFSLFSPRFEAQLEQITAIEASAAVELAKEWRKRQNGRHLEALCWSPTTALTFLSAARRRD